MGAVPSSQDGSSNGGMVPKNEMNKEGMKENDMNTQNETEITRNACNSGGEGKENGAVLSSVMQEGVVPDVERKIRKRKAMDNEVAVQRDDEEREKPAVKYIGE